MDVWLTVIAVVTVVVLLLIFGDRKEPLVLKEGRKVDYIRDRLVPGTEWTIRNIRAGVHPNICLHLSAGERGSERYLNLLADLATGRVLRRISALPETGDFLEGNQVVDIRPTPGRTARSLVTVESIDEDRMVRCLQFTHMVEAATGAIVYRNVYDV